MLKLSEFGGSDAERLRMKYVMDCFTYVKSKGTRDLLMELGLVRNAIALDVRVQNVLKKVGIPVPEGLKGNAKLYGKVQDEIIEKICEPLGVSGIEFDRMLYQNYDEIMSTTL
jgi:hypothetical protein